MRWGTSMAWDKLFGRGSSASAKGAVANSADPAVSRAESNTLQGKRQARRSKRVFISMRIVVKFQRDAQPYKEETLTEAVNAHGCLLRLSVAPKSGQNLTVVNAKSNAEAECRVAYVGHSEDGKTKVGLEFLQPAEHFWHIAFPPDDWNAADFQDAVIDRPATHQPQKLA
jgi:hypothetical protein